MECVPGSPHVRLLTLYTQPSPKRDNNMAQPTAQQQQPSGESATVQNMDPNFILSLARDNKANELAAMVRQLGVPVNTANKVGGVHVGVSASVGLSLPAPC